MSIEVILKEHVEHLGHRGEIVRVASGYARNFLFPRQLALVVTEREQEADRARTREGGGAGGHEMAAAQALAAKLEGQPISIGRRVGENETLYGSVTTADIAEALAAREIIVDRRKIQLADPLKSLGEHIVPVKLYRDVTANLKVTIVPAA